MKKRKIFYILIPLVLIIGVAIFCYFYFIKMPNKAIEERCIEYNSKWANLEDCYGFISIRYGWDINYYYLMDHVHGYEVARIYNLSQYIYENNRIFVINRQTIENNSSNGTKTTYYQELFQNAELIENSYSTISDIPTYLVIDTTSGEVRAYKNITEVPENEQNYFRELENK